MEMLAHVIHQAQIYQITVLVTSAIRLCEQSNRCRKRAGYNTEFSACSNGNDGIERGRLTGQAAYRNTGGPHAD
jgi:hypothetical protein